MQRGRLSLSIEVGKPLVSQFILLIGLVQLEALEDNLGLVYILYSLTLVCYPLLVVEVPKFLLLQV